MWGPQPTVGAARIRQLNNTAFSRSLILNSKVTLYHRLRQIRFDDINPSLIRPDHSTVTRTCFRVFRSHSEFVMDSYRSLSLHVKRAIGPFWSITHQERFREIGGKFSAATPMDAHSIFLGMQLHPSLVTLCERQHTLVCDPRADHLVKSSVPSITHGAA